MIASVSTKSKIVVEKSTVPVKTAEAIEKVWLLHGTAVYSDDGIVHTQHLMLTARPHSCCRAVFLTELLLRCRF